MNKPISEMNELELYFLIDFIGGFCWHMNHDMSMGRIPDSEHAAIDADITRMRGEQLAAIKELPRIGIAVPLTEADKPTESYWTWYRTWDKWKRDMSNSEWEAFDAETKNGMLLEHVDKYKKEAFIGKKHD